MINGVHHVAISTGNLERALEFYRDILGLDVVLEGGWEKDTPAGRMADRITGLQGSATQMAMLRAGNAMIEIFQYDSPEPGPGDPGRPVCDHGLTHICLDVTDVDAEYKRLEAAGMRFHCPPQMLGRAVKTTYGRDPDGNVIEIQEILWPESKISLCPARAKGGGSEG
ncbi:MAG: VOC family protein [Proteobacteria bacterium]|nr:VOC family protein [Pseudomonadota bacterium]